MTTKSCFVDYEMQLDVLNVKLESEDIYKLLIKLFKLKRKYF